MGAHPLGNSARMRYTVPRDSGQGFALGGRGGNRARPRSRGGAPTPLFPPSYDVPLLAFGNTTSRQMRQRPFTLSAGILPSMMPLLIDPTCSPVTCASSLGVMNSGTSSNLAFIASLAFPSVSSVGSGPGRAARRCHVVGRRLPAQP